MNNVDNLFELVLIASKRARQLSNGAPTDLEWENDKPTVMALREIAEGRVDASIPAADPLAGRLIPPASATYGLRRFHPGPPAKPEALHRA